MFDVVEERRRESQSVPVSNLLNNLCIATLPRQGLLKKTVFHFLISSGLVEYCTWCLFFSPTQDASVTPDSSDVEEGRFEFLFLQHSVRQQTTSLHQHHRRHRPARECSLNRACAIVQRQFVLKHTGRESSSSVHKCLSDSALLWPAPDFKISLKFRLLSQDQIMCVYLILECYKISADVETKGNYFFYWIWPELNVKGVCSTGLSSAQFVTGLVDLCRLHQLCINFNFD